MCSKTIEECRPDQGDPFQTIGNRVSHSLENSPFVYAIRQEIRSVTGHPGGYSRPLDPDSVTPPAQLKSARSKGRSATPNPSLFLLNNQVAS